MWEGYKRKLKAVVTTTCRNYTYGNFKNLIYLQEYVGNWSSDLTPGYGGFIQSLDWTGSLDYLTELFFSFCRYSFYCNVYLVLTTPSM